METLQPNVGAAISITYSAALIAFLSRFFARKWNGVPFIAGDWVSAVAFFFVTAYNILFLIKLKFGLGLRRENIALRKHDGSINYDSMAHEYFFFLYPDMWLYTAAMGMSKMTALALQWRLFGKSATRYWILLLVGCVVWWMFARCVVILAIVHLALEVCIVALPWYEIRRLKRARREKIAIAAMFSSGSLVCIASLVQLILATQFNATSQELWWINTPHAIAAIVEINLAHLSTSLPNLRPVLKCLRSGGAVRTEPPRRKTSTGILRPSDSHAALSPEASSAKTRQLSYEGLLARPEHVVLVERGTSWLSAYDRRFSRTEIASLRNFQVEPLRNVYSLKPF
ncbi:hypothetical protein DPSP01_004018 [Paraphaeosphaeria sporulosa]